MILGIDASRAVKKERTGVEWYSYFLIQAMEKCVIEGWKVRLYTPTNYELGANIRTESENWKWQTLKWPGKGWTQGRLSLEMMTRPPDVLFVPSHTIPFLHPEKTITTIHDVVFLKYPELYDPKDLKAQIRGFNFAKRFAKKIIVPSRATRDDVVRAGVEKERVVVVEHGVEINHNPPQPPLQNVKCQMSNVKYILFVGRIEKKKNLMNLIHAFREVITKCTTLSDVQAAAQHSVLSGWELLNTECFHAQHSVLGELKLVLAGSKGYGAEDIDLAIKTFKLQDRVVQLGWIDGEQYIQLLRNASLFILPSFGEGFGLPVLEAMAAGVPIVCSDIPVLREVGGNAVQYVDPHNPGDIARGIEAVLNNEMLGSEMIKRGREIAREYTWEKSAKSIWEIISGL